MPVKNVVLARRDECDGHRLRFDGVVDNRRSFFVFSKKIIPDLKNDTVH